LPHPLTVQQKKKFENRIMERGATSGNVNGTPFSERLFSERPFSERPFSERPFSEPPFSERPISERPISERPIPEGDHSLNDHSPNDQSPKTANPQKTDYCQAKEATMGAIFAMAKNREKTFNILPDFLSLLHLIFHLYHRPLNFYRYNCD
jgi:hypothetical protein